MRAATWWAPTFRSPVRPFARSPVRPFARSPVRPFARRARRRSTPLARGALWHAHEVRRAREGSGAAASAGGLPTAAGRRAHYPRSRAARSRPSSLILDRSRNVRAPPDCRAARVRIHHKGVRIPHLQSDRNRLVSRPRTPSRARSHPQILLTRRQMNCRCTHHGQQAHLRPGGRFCSGSTCH